MNQAHLILESLSTLDNYAIIKIKPNYVESFAEGGDIDIVTSNIDAAIESLYGWYRNKFDYKLHVKNITRDHSYFDVYKNSKLVIRYDFYKNFGSYKRVKIKPHFFQEIILNRRKVVIQDGSNNFEIYTPCLKHEALIRFIEYCEYYWVGPDKFKHIDFIDSKKLNTDDFFEALHYYTEISQDYPNNPGASSSYKKLLLDIKKVKSTLRVTPLRLWPNKFFVYIKKLCL